MREMSEKKAKIYIAILATFIIAVSGIIFTTTEDLSYFSTVCGMGGLFIVGTLLFMKFAIGISNAVEEWLDEPIVDSNKVYPHADFANAQVKYRVWRLADGKTSSLSTVAKKGAFLIEGDYITLHEMAFSVDDIQWFGRDKNSHDVRLDVNKDGWWYVIKIDPGYGGHEFVRAFTKVIPDYLNKSSYLYRPNRRSPKATSAYITKQDLQGIYKNQEVVDLYITPLWMVVLYNGRVIRQHFIDNITDIAQGRHLTALEDELNLLTFCVDDEDFAYALKDDNFINQLSDAMQGKIDEIELRKRK